MSKTNRRRGNRAGAAPVWASQNFLTSAAVINRIVSRAGLCHTDHVVEIGPGKGHITKKLLAACGRVTAVEIDRNLYDKLSVKFEHQANLNLVHGDFLRWPLPLPPYKVFANIPFNRTTEIIRKLCAGQDGPDALWLVVEKGAAKRFLGQPRESLSSLLLKPFYDAKIVYYFRREDFHPAPSVDAVLLHLAKKPAPDVPERERGLYERFLRAQFGPSREMRYVQWLCLFRRLARR
ncbi:MAG: rRNA adenine N(6)-methyltransferase family protein [Firmicutes bacterium]|nr:rRNA adenine N(6)-methyltransferase family protein [Bacillota bacterium]